MYWDRGRLYLVLVSLRERGKEERGEGKGETGEGGKEKGGVEGGGGEIRATCRPWGRGCGGPLRDGGPLRPPVPPRDILLNRHGLTHSFAYTD